MGTVQESQWQMHMVECLYGANPAPQRGPLDSGGAAWEQCRDATQRNDNDDECNKYNELMFEVISEKNIQNVILSARWIVYTKGRSEIEPLSEKDPLIISYDEKNSNGRLQK